MDTPVSGDNHGDGVVKVKLVVGLKDLHDKWIATMSALRDAELFDELKMLYERVIAPAGGDFYNLIEPEPVNDNTVKYKYKPMIELVFSEVVSAATAPGWTEAMRKERIAETLMMAGF